MTRRAMTLVELLLAFALLSGLTLACVAWTTAAARALATEGGRVSWRAAAERSVELVNEALAIEDAGLHTGGGREDLWRRVEIGDGTILVRTRVTVSSDRPAVAAAMRLRVTNGVLRAEWLDDEEREIVSRPLLGEVAAVTVDSHELEDGRVVLTVRLVHTAGASVQRAWRLSQEDAR